MGEDLLDVSGSCYCRAVRYRASGVRPQVTECHCTQCRKQSGHRYATTATKASNMEIEGDDKITWYQATAHGERGFCSVCGSTLFWKRPGQDYCAILAGTIDEPNDLVLAKHIFVSDKGGYYEINDGLPKHRAYG